MQLAWDDFVSDTGCFPDCFEFGPNRTLYAYFDRGNFARLVAMWLEPPMPEAEVFVLDRAENPHPRMLAEALLARATRFDSTEALAYWHGYLAAMCGATGCPPDEIEAWLIHNEAIR